MKILSKLDNTGMIDEVTDKRFVTDAEKSVWNGKADKTYVDNKVKTNVPVGAKFTDTVYTHPASHPASMITGLPTSLPANGGNADTVGGFTVGVNVPANAKFTDTNTTYSEISTAEIDAGTASTGRTITGRRVKYILDKISGMISAAIGALTKSSVGLGNVDNTSDASKPISTATQAALDGKVNNSQVLTNVPSGAKFTDTITTINGKTGAISKADIVALGIPAQDTVVDISGIEGAIYNIGQEITGVQGDIYSIGQDVAGLDTWFSDHKNDTSNPHLVTKAQVGLSNVDNLSAASIRSGTTKTHVGLGNVDNVKQMPISGGVLENYREKLVTISAGSGTINLSLGNVFVHTPSGTRTYIINNAVGGQAHSFTLIVNMGSTARTLVFPSSIKWQGGEIPDLTTANKTYVLTFMTVDGGTTWLGMFGGEF